RSTRICIPARAGGVHTCGCHVDNTGKRRPRMVVWPVPIPPMRWPATLRRRGCRQTSFAFPMDAWPRCLERLQAEFPAEDVHTWLKPLQADERPDALVLYAPNAFIVEQVRDRYLPRIRELVQHFAGHPGVAL